MVIWVDEDDGRAGPGSVAASESSGGAGGAHDEGADLRGPRGKPAPEAGANVRMACGVRTRLAGCRSRCRSSDRRARPRRPEGLGVILDTNAVSALFVGDRALERLLSRASRHELPVIVIGEYR